MSSNQFKVSFAPALGLGSGTSYEEPFDTLQEAVAAKSTIANYTLHLHKVELMDDHSNYSYISRLVDGDWEEMDEGEIEDLIENEGVNDNAN